MPVMLVAAVLVAAAPVVVAAAAGKTGLAARCRDLPQARHHPGPIPGRNGKHFPMLQGVQAPYRKTS